MQEMKHNHLKGRTVQKYNSIDIGKFIMAICVIAIHTQPLEGVHNEIILAIYSNFVSCAAPFFFLASGFLLARKFKSPLDTYDNIIIVRNYLFHIAKLYIIWTIIYLPMAIYHFVDAGISFKESISLYRTGFIFLGEQYNSWMLWYLLSTVYALIFIMICLKKHASLIRINVYASIIMIVSISIDCLMNSSSVLALSLGIVQKVIRNSIANGRILHGLFYIPFGMLLWYKRINIKYSLAAFILSFAARCFTQNVVVSSLLGIVNGVSFFSAVKEVDLPNAPRYATYRKISIGMYFTHMYIWTLYYTIAYGKKTFGFDCFVVTLILSVILSYLYTRVKDIKSTSRLQLQ